MFRFRRDIHGRRLSPRFHWWAWRMERRRRKNVGDMQTDISEHIKKYDRETVCSSADHERGGSAGRYLRHNDADDPFCDKIGGRRDRTESAANAAGDLNPARYTTPGAPSVPRGDAAGLRRPRLLSPHLPRGPVGRCGKPVDAP